ncbi:hypothetical protein LTR70_009233 [Exophiala xenobiotica]|uniref:Uncharacterized protein n=1 Tax=Lithohypha guttulata TaxID=1690604 RepID=A0ABR0JW55_9EURO|nr:hypothetical protein LTR24_010008 [Lithohypha guttulata]KAK5310775.1 hypothetical protein LTR70_009233 [Exophiala xenobiotica]
MARVSRDDVLPRRLPSGKLRQRRPRGFFGASRTADSRPTPLTYARPTIRDIDGAWRYWIRFCEEELTQEGDPTLDPVHEAMRLSDERDFQVVQLFLEWVLDKRNVHLDTMMVFCRVWRQAYRHHVGRQIDHCFIAVMKSVLFTRFPAGTGSR